MSTSVLKALPGKLDIKRHSPNILYIPWILSSAGIISLRMSELVTFLLYVCVSLFVSCLIYYTQYDICLFMKRSGHSLMVFE